jgi:hypothetical protein
MEAEISSETVVSSKLRDATQQNILSAIFYYYYYYYYHHHHHHHHLQLGFHPVAVNNLHVYNL